MRILVAVIYCNELTYSQLSHLQDIQSALEETLDVLETEGYHNDRDKYIARAEHLFEQVNSLSRARADAEASTV